MFNKPTNFFDDSSRSGGWDLSTDRHPVGRLVCVFLLLSSLLLLIGVRLFQVQSMLQPQVIAEFRRTAEEETPLPCRDGRILSRDGFVLAEDIRRYHVAMHYRWLEQPVDSGWLRTVASRSLPSKLRRDPDRVIEAIGKAHRKREAMWSRLADTAGIGRNVLRARMDQVQKRIQRMKQAVDARRTTRISELHDQNPPRSVTLPWYRHWPRIIWDELTTPPHRMARDPLVIREELDYHRIVDDVPLQIALEIESHPELYPGLQIQRETERRYPMGELAAHVIGTRTERQPEERAGKNYVTGRLGRSGVEQQYDRLLTGRPGYRLIRRDRRGEIVQSEIGEVSRNGRDVQLTVHAGLQRKTERLLDDAIGPEGSQVGPRGGSIVVMDVRNGEILAMANAPRFDLNLLIRPDPDDWQALTSNDCQPMFPRASRMTVAPGSVFKTLSAIALLEAGIIDPDENRGCQGFLHSPQRYRCYIFRHYGVGHGELTLVDAIARSCNVYFYSAAESMGPEPFVTWARRFGFGRVTGLDLPGEKSGNLPYPQQQKDGRRIPWYKGDTLGLAIGQSRLTVTPLQIARMMAAIANGGDLVHPHVFLSARDLDQSGLAAEPSSSPRVQPIEGLHPETIERVREGLQMVVANPRGTGYRRVRSRQISIAGKTGTAEVGGGRNDHAWFAGFLPANQPRYAFAIVLENGGSGGSVAGPVAKALAESLVELGLTAGSSQLAVRE